MVVRRDCNFSVTWFVLWLIDDRAYTSTATTMAHVLRPTQIDLGSILAQQNPQIDLRISAYEASTRNFLKAVSNYSNRAIAEITKRKERQAQERKKLAEKKAAVEAETNQCKVKEIELVASKSVPLRAVRWLMWG